MTGEELRSPAVLVGRGARVCERALLTAVERLLACSTDGDLSLPVRIIVPSRSLRQHLQGRLVTRHACLGVHVQTLRGVAAEILERAGEALPASAALLETLTARAAGGKATLSGSLGSLVDGWRPLTETVRDLLDAGFGEAHLEAVLERVAELGPVGDRTLDRVRAVVEVAAEVEEAASRLGVGGTTALWRRAASLLSGRGPELLPSNAVFVHGFAEATGLALDLLEILVRETRACVFVDEPEDPARPGEPDSGRVFTCRLRERLAGWRGEMQLSHGSDAPATLRFLGSEGVEGEVRAVGIAVRILLDSGVAPESIGVVARQLAPREAAVAVHWQRLGIPLSVEGGRGLVGPACRRLAAVGDLLLRGARTSVDTWLAAATNLPAVDDLRLALRLAGAATVGEVADLSVAELLGGAERLGLPVRTGLDAEDDCDGTRLVAPRRWVSRGCLEDAVAKARRLCVALASKGSARAGRHLAGLRSLVEGDLGLPEREREGMETVLSDLDGSVPGDLVLEWPEWVRLVRRAVADAGREPVGGSGAGVRLLGVTQARGLTFGHLFVMGLNRDVFPRVVSEDPLLPDWVRGALLPVLPDLHVKAGGHDEERYLFAHLLGAAPSVTLSWQAADDDGHVANPSPLVQRLRLERPEVEVESLGATLCSPEGGPATGLEHAVACGLAGDRVAWEAVVALAMTESDRPSAGLGRELAAARRRVLDEVDPEGWQTMSSPSPYLGLVGARDPGGELEGMLFVTTLEAMSRCPWRTFLERVLRIESPRDPMQELGGIDSRLVGSVVHGVLAAVAAEHTGSGPRWEAILGGMPSRRVWPSPAELETLTARVAAEVARQEGGLPPGLVLALSRRVQPFLQVAAGVDWSKDLPAILGVEVPGLVAVRDARGRRRSLRFKCDRVDREAGGGVVGTDYKTGRVLSDASRESTRRTYLRQAIRKGEALQAAAYAGAAVTGGRGRYLYLAPDVPEPVREHWVARDDPEVMADFEAAVSTLLGAWDSGVFLPRLTDPSGRERSPACAFCEMREACVQYDSGMKRRLLAWVGTEEGDGVNKTAAQLWNLAAPPVEEGGGA